LTNFRRAWSSLFRHYRSTLTILIPLFLAFTVIITATSLHHGLTSIHFRVKSEVAPVATIEQDYHAMRLHEEKTGRWPHDVALLTPEILDAIATLPYVVAHDYSTHAVLYGKGTRMHPCPPDFMNDHSIRPEWTHIWTKGVRSEALFEIEQGIIEIIEGRPFEAREIDRGDAVILVSETFAHNNRLKAGSTLTLHNTAWNLSDPQGHDELMYSSENIVAQEAIDFKVIGIFAPKISYDTGDRWTDQHYEHELLNRIYLPNEFCINTARFQWKQAALLDPHEEHWQQDPRAHVWYESIYLLEGHEHEEAFALAARGILPDFYRISYTSDSYTETQVLIDSVALSSQHVAWAAAAVGIVLLSVMTTVALSARRREMKNRIMHGEPQRMIATQLAFELTMIAVVAFLLAFVVALAIMPSIGRFVLSYALYNNDILMQARAFGTLDAMGYTNRFLPERVLGAVTPSLGFWSILQLIGVGSAMVAVSFAAPLAYLDGLSKGIRTMSVQ